MIEKHLKPNYFFFLLSFPHRSLFLENEYVWHPLHLLKEYLEGQASWKIEVPIPPTTILENASQISIGPGTIIEPGALIRGPCILGSNCIVRQGAYIRGEVIAGDGCVIGHDTEIKHSILLPNAKAAHFAYVGDSILGNGVNLGAGVKCANLRLDHKDIIIRIEGKSVDTGEQKIGAIIGDHTQIGCNVVLNPGTLIGKKTLCYPLTCIGGFIPPHSVIKHQSADY